MISFYSNASRDVPALTRAPNEWKERKISVSGTLYPKVCIKASKSTQAVTLGNCWDKWIAFWCNESSLHAWGYWVSQCCCPVACPSSHWEVVDFCASVFGVQTQTVLLGWMWWQQRPMPGKEKVLKGWRWWALIQLRETECLESSFILLLQAVSVE